MARIKGIGVDIVEIGRITNAVKNAGTRFLERVFSDHEINYCRRRKKMKYPELAARFAAKEAYAKALGTGMRGINWKQIETVNNPAGKPLLRIKGKILVRSALSLSHSKKYAVAIVVLEG